MRKKIQDPLPLQPQAKAQAAKTTTYALMHLVVAVAVAYALTGSWQLALGIGLIEPAVQTVAYALHERAWSRRLTPDTAPQEGSETGSARRPLMPDCGRAIQPVAGC
jgi:uncharacterized membrane protein